jgi:hypothetical protein
MDPQQQNPQPAPAQPQAQVQSSDPAFDVLNPMPIGKQAKQQAWEVFHNTDGPDFEQKLGQLNLPKPIKQQLWEAKQKQYQQQDQQHNDGGGRDSSSGRLAGDDDVETGLRKASNAPPTLAESQHPTMTGVKRGLEGAAADTLGVAKTGLSDIGGALGAALKLPQQIAGHVIDSINSPDVIALRQRQDLHKQQVYSDAANEFHQGHYAKAVSHLVDLFDPKYDDPNDPISKIMKSQWDSSMQAKNKMVQAAQAKDYPAVVQHAAGILPIASQVDQAMENYRQDPSHENLAHVLVSALPAFVPALLKSNAAVATANGARSVASGAVDLAKAGAEELSDKLSTHTDATLGSSAVDPQAAGTQVQGELASGQNQVVPSDAPSSQEGGQGVQDAMQQTRDIQGQQVAATKAAARPEGFKMRIGEFYTDLGQKLSAIDDKIGGESTGLSTVKDPELENVRKMIADDFGSSRELSNTEIDKVREQLNSKISQQTQSVKMGNSTGTALNYYKQIKKAFDDEMYAQVSDPNAAELSRAANKTYAETVARQTKGTSKTAFKTQSPEQIITRTAKAGPAQQSEIQGIMKDLSPEATTRYQNSVLKQIVDNATSGGKTAWDKVQGQLDKMGETGKTLFGDRYQQLYSEVARNAKLGDIKGMSPEGVIVKFAKAGAEDQSQVEALMSELSPSGQKVLQDSVLKHIVDMKTVTGKTDWFKVQERLAEQGNTAKSLLGDTRYKEVMEEVAHNAKLQKTKGIAVKAAGAFGIAAAWQYYSHLRNVLSSGPAER